MIPFLRKMSGKIGNPNDKGAEDKEVSNQSSLPTL